LRSSTSFALAILNIVLLVALGSLAFGLAGRNPFGEWYAARDVRWLATGGLLTELFPLLDPLDTTDGTR